MRPDRRAHAAVGATCLVYPKLLDMPASRRLQLAAEAGGGLGILVLHPKALAQPSAARTRWRISAAPRSPDMALSDTARRILTEAGRHPLRDVTLA